MMPRKVLLLGREGQVGFELKRLLAPKVDLVAFDLDDLDLSQPGKIPPAVRKINPSLILNAAAYTQVDKAEEDRELATILNAEVPKVLAETAKDMGAALVHYSTDYVYSGEKNTPYSEDDAPAPLGVYGQTKLDGDEAVRAADAPHLIFRTSWVYGNRGKNFFLTMSRLAKEKVELKVVDDQHGGPTWCRSIAEGTVSALQKVMGPNLEGDVDALRDVSGVYHLTCGGSTTWYGFTRAIVDGLQLENPPKLIPIPTSGYPTPARRPENSVLDNGKLETVFGVRLPTWEQALNDCLDNRENT